MAIGVELNLPVSGVSANLLSFPKIIIFHDMTLNVFLLSIVENLNGSQNLSLIVLLVQFRNKIILLMNCSCS